MAYRELILTNFRRKLFALLLAVLVWLTIHFAENKKHRAAAPNPATNPPAFTP